MRVGHVQAIGILHNHVEGVERRRVQPGHHSRHLLGRCRGWADYLRVDQNGGGFKAAIGKHDGGWHGGCHLVVDLGGIERKK